MAENKELQNLPSVNEVLAHPDVAELAGKHGRAVVKHATQQAIGRARTAVLDGGEAPDDDAIAADVAALVETICGESLRPVVNATGVVLHTNLGRAPLGRAVVDDIVEVASGYSNLEFDLEAGRRGNRHIHAREILKFLTAAEDALVVNNNAAAIILLLSTLARDREVVISRGELIEIGGAFRIPDIMAAGGVRMVEVGTTNRTRLADYEAAINDQTAMLFKAHKSNYSIAGFTEEATVRELADLAHARGLVMTYDIGSGLLRELAAVPLPGEPDVRSAIAAGADLVTFSCDKLLGGPQAGVVAGKRELVSRLAEAPMMRALRVGKLTLAGLAGVCRAYLREEDLLASNPALAMLARSQEDLNRIASELLDELKRCGVAARLTDSVGHSGGGSSPDVELESIAVEVLPQGPKSHRKPTFAERLFADLLRRDRPILGVLREGRILFDVLALFEHDIPGIAKGIAESVAAGEQP